jgi:TonB family protein
MRAVRQLVFLASVGLGLNLPSAAVAATLKPFKPWIVDYAEAQCIATRDYGSSGHPVTLGIRPSPNGETYELLVARAAPTPPYAQEIEGNVDFGQGALKAWVLRFRPADSNLDVYQFRIGAAEMAKARGAAEMALRAKGGPDFQFELGSIPQLLDGLSACTDNLKQFWNMGGEKDGRIATPSKGDLRSVFSPDDYPWEAQYRGQQGDGQYLLLVDEKGSVAGCHVLKPTGVPVLDAMACAVIQKRAKFKPALDPRGKPVRSTFVTPPINWKLG